MSDGLVVCGLGVSYGNARALYGVTAAFAAGRVNAVVGSNGAGKSSLLLAVAGAIASTGEAMLDGRDLRRLSPRGRARAGISIVPQCRQVFPCLSVRENLQVRAGVLGLGRTQVEAALDMFGVLRTRQAVLAGVLSGGEEQMLAVARALMGDPRVILMDEMATVLAPMIVRQLMRTTTDIAVAGRTVVVAKPSIGAIYRSLDRGYVLLRGAVVGEATGGEEISRAYQDRMGVGG
jgi:branched-chain amino acid transport system ATP-binding protein